ncbi:isoaspartyl dipeptidase [Halobacillus andaensis]|uniref:Isoaspartyl dipeptidase n=1 Tax=Halobacillus andaensis TaxID=1176239 RepID=A0A917EVV6_HALAA|nr:beta-aspartyl-peptidase [Halobacillus andaensis]MBP2004724.1 beta-aspartyl-dipeptidase (metallo-type) [Halobacillus andaensis]GGF19470.1 isoaspartyl dipeptidase [Halobacillus andaensis]
MLTLIKNTTVYSPHYLGVKDVLLTDQRIAKISDQIDLPAQYEWINIIDGTDKILTPGFIDGHVHITGGGGEGSFKTRTPELSLTDATTSGVTTVVGVIGTDGTTRTMTNLVAKAKALREEGISCYAHTGSYQIPVRTLTGKIEDDLMLIDLIIGAGEIAIADHRSSQPTVDELARLASQARIGGMLSGKKGVVNIHLGDSPDHLSLIEKVVEQSDLPISQFYPTHINRNRLLFEAGIHYAKNGGYVDFTTSTIPKFLEDGEVKSSLAVKEMLDAGVPIEQMTFTSDAQGSLPDFNEKGELIGLKVGRVRSLYEAFVETVKVQRVPLEQALQVITSNPAHVLGLTDKGVVGEGKDADLALLDPDTLAIDTVIANGQIMVQEGHPIVKGTFES